MQKKRGKSPENLMFQHILLYLGLNDSNLNVLL